MMPQGAELEDQDAGLLPVWLQSANERLLEERRIEERRILQTRERPVARVHRPQGNRDLLRDLETPAERFRCLAEQPGPERIRWKLIEREVAADRREHGRILAETGLLEQLFGKTPARAIQGSRIDLPQPAFGFPPASADENTAFGELIQAVAKTLTIKRDRLIQREERVQ